jgi:DNA-binding Xre family transcriptional regulator
MTPTQISNATGISRQSIYNMEEGVSAGLMTYAVICEELNVPIDDLLKGIVPRKKVVIPSFMKGVINDVTGA